MARFALRNCIITFVINLVISLVSCVVVGGLTLLFSFKHFGKVSVIVPSVVCCIIATAAVCLLHRVYRIRIDWFGIPDYFDIEYLKQVNGKYAKSPTSSHLRFVVNCIREKMFYKAKDARLTFLPCLVIGIVFVALIAVFYASLVWMFGNAELEIMQWCLYIFCSVLLSTSSTTWLLVGVLGLISSDLNYDCCCQHCKSLLPFIQLETADNKGCSNATVVTLCTSCGAMHFAEYRKEERRLRK